MTSILVCSRLVSLSEIDVAPFPVVIGGGNGTTILLQFEYYTPSDLLAAVGYTVDLAIRGDNTGFLSIPSIAVYEGPTMSYKWGKTVQT